MTQALLLIGHGSREMAGNAQFLALAAAVAGRLPGVPVAPCFLDHAEPSIPATIDRIVAEGATRIGVVPLFLFAAGHALRDVPAHLATAQDRYGDRVAFRYGRVLGVHSVLLQACAGALTEVGALAREGDLRDTVVLLVGRGSSTPAANEALWQIARLLWDQTHCAFVECAYSDVARPSVEEGLERCVQLGARRVVVLPYFLFKGVLMDRLAALVARWQERHPDRIFRFVGRDGLAAHPGLVDLVVERALETLS